MSKTDKFLGKYFQVPLENEMTAIGLVVRQNGSSLLSYFFQMQTSNDLTEAEFNPEQSICVTMHGPLGFIQNEWTILGSLPSFREDNWPIPPLKLLDRLRKVWMKLTYEDDLNTHVREDISEEEAELMFNAGIAGHVFVQNRLEKILVGNQASAAKADGNSIHHE